MNELTIFASEQNFELGQRIAKALSTSSLVPREYQSNLGNCLIAMNMANRLGCDPLMVMQSLHVIHGKPSFSSAFLIALVNSSGKLQGSLRFKSDADGCAAWGIEAGTDVELWGPAVTLDMARAEGWSTRQGSKWQTMPELMLRYRAAAFWCRLYTPELALGFQTAEELEDITAKPEPRRRYRDQRPPTVDHPESNEALVGEIEPLERDEKIEQLEQRDDWPKHLEADGDKPARWVDSAGELYDPSSHAWSKDNDRPGVRKDGTFRARRGAPAPEPEPHNPLPPLDDEDFGPPWVDDDAPEVEADHLPGEPL